MYINALRENVLPRSYAQADGVGDVKGWTVTAKGFGAMISICFCTQMLSFLHVHGLIICSTHFRQAIVAKTCSHKRAERRIEKHIIGAIVL